MSAQEAFPGMANEADARAEETDTAEREDDPTPRGVIRAVLEAAVKPSPFSGFPRLAEAPIWEADDEGDMAPLRVLDVCAGYGAWASELRRLAVLQGWPVHITGVEICEARREYLARWCDDPMIADWAEYLEAVDGTDFGDFDIVIGNPHFTALTHEDPAQSMPAILLEHAPAVLLLHTQQAFLRGAAGRAAWRRCPPAACWLVPGAVGFRGPGKGTDARCYQVTLWLRGHEGPCSVHLLDDLDARARAWVVAPGSELPSADLPAAPGWTP